MGNLGSTETFSLNFVFHFTKHFETFFVLVSINLFFPRCASELENQLFAQLLDVKKKNPLLLTWMDGWIHYKTYRRFRLLFICMKVTVFTMI